MTPARIIRALTGRPPPPSRQEIVDLATREPGALTPLFKQAAGRRRPLPGLDDEALALVPEGDLAGLADAAVEALRRGRHPEHSPAAELVGGLSLQARHTLRPHLAELWNLRPTRASHAYAWPWRGAEPGDDIDFLVSRLASEDPADRMRAWECLLESRTEPGWEAALPAFGEAVPDDWRTREMIGSVGIEPTDGGYRRLFMPTTTHVEFPRGFLVLPKGSGIESPTWHLDAPTVGSGRFGGVADSACAVCDEPLHRLLALDDVPEEVAPGIEVVTCLSCLGWSVPVMYFRHGPEGGVQPVVPQGTDAARRDPADPLPEVTVTFKRTPARWQLQDWGHSNGRQNLHRLGGEPTWIQSPDYPACLDCGQAMTFFLQLDSLDIEGGPWWLWGSGGAMYAFWCDRCRLTATFWQCT